MNGTPKRNWSVTHALPIEPGRNGRRRDYLSSYIERDGCWIYTGSVNNRGYGTILGKAAHRYFYEHLVAPIPAGLVIDHLCRVKLCVNPDHLEVVSQKENAKRRPDVEKSHCLRGHELTTDNIRLQVSPEGWRMRQCKECRREADRARQSES